jgi:hypothetical protein
VGQRRLAGGGAGYEAIHQLLGDTGAVEFVVLCGDYSLVSFLLNASDVPLPPGATPRWDHQTGDGHLQGGGTFIPSVAASRATLGRAVVLPADHGSRLAWLYRASHRIGQRLRPGGQLGSRTVPSRLRHATVYS